MIRTFHKYLSLVISIQLLLWTISGIYFAFNKIELIRGEQYLLNEDVSKLDLTNIKGNFNTKNINNVKNEYKIKIFVNCFKVSVESKVIKLVNDFFKLLSKISIRRIIEDKK